VLHRVRTDPGHEPPGILINDDDAASLGHICRLGADGLTPGRHGGLPDAGEQAVQAPDLGDGQRDQSGILGWLIVWARRRGRQGGAAPRARGGDGADPDLVATVNG
jgi:hypothetical protein